MKVYIVLTYTYDIGINELNKNDVECFNDAEKAIDYYCENKPAEIIVKELEDE